MATRAWYSYSGTSGGEFNPINYFYVTSAPICSIVGSEVCSLLGIYLSWSSHPATFSTNINSYVATALAFGVAQPLLPGQKKYVYMRG